VVGRVAFSILAAAFTAASVPFGHFAVLHHRTLIAALGVRFVMTAARTRFRAIAGCRRTLYRL
jgi:hypothetical protein